MRKHLLHRAALVLGIALAVLLPPTPARATTVGTATFVGNAVLTNPFDFPCIDPGKQCPPIDTNNVTQPRIDPKTGVPIPSPYFSGNITQVRLTSTTCADTKVSVNKPKAPLAVGACSITANWTMKGHCGMATGMGTLTYTSSNGTNYGFAIDILHLHSELIIKGGTPDKNVYGVLHWQWGPGCQNKTATTAVVWGTLHIKHLTNLP